MLFMIMISRVLVLVVSCVQAIWFDMDLAPKVVGWSVNSSIGCRPVGTICVGRNIAVGVDKWLSFRLSISRPLSNQVSTVGVGAVGVRVVGPICIGRNIAVGVDKRLGFRLSISRPLSNHVSTIGVGAVGVRVVGPIVVGRVEKWISLSISRPLSKQVMTQVSSVGGVGVVCAIGSHIRRHKAVGVNQGRVSLRLSKNK